jgi:anti-sigma regulatory factor (Ser/Thr protein kinase)
MCRLAEAEFAADAATAKAARDWVAGVLELWDLTEPELTETAALLTSETVTNAVRHAASAPTVTAAMTDGVVEIGVSDRESGTSPHVSMVDDPLATGGRGLAIVDALADEWGTAYRNDGKQVWFRLQTSGWSHATECHCHGDDPSGVELQSGRRVLVN